MTDLPNRTRVTPKTFAATQLHLLTREQNAELEENALILAQTAPSTLARAGLAILNLVVADQRTGLGGKTVVELEVDSAVRGSKKDAKSGTNGAAKNAPSEGPDLTEHGIRTGDIVGLAEQPAGSAKKSEKSELKKKGVEGVVVRVQRDKINVAVDERGEQDGGVDQLESKRLWLVKLANDVTFKRMNQVMTRLHDMSGSDYSSFIQTVFGLSSVTPPQPEPVDKIEWNDPTLNDSQKDAVAFALASPEIALIHGPPGTGKTHTLIELILQMLKRGLRLLVCGPSNISVDNIVERLAPHKVPILRLGHPARLLPSVLNHSLEVLTKTSEAAAIVQDVRKEMDDKQASIRKTKSGKERKAIYGEIRELRKEYRDREGKCVDNLVKGSKVVLATLHGAGGYQLRNQEFDVVIIDEASQALEAQCWVPLLKAKKVVLAGDHLQLPPTIKSSNSKSDKEKKTKTNTDGDETLVKGMTLETTMFDRLLKLHGPGIKRMLTTQYRMHEKIMSFPSAELYEGKLIAAEGVKLRLLKDLEYEVESTDDTIEPLVFIDTQGGDFAEKIDDEEIGGSGKKASFLGESKSNDAEASLVARHVSSLISAGVKAEDIAVITPYNAQVALLSSLLRDRYPGIEIGSVDGFQGREKEAVIVSLVRSGGEVGFLAEKRRLNVSMTRPRRHLCVVGDSGTLSKGSGFLKRWMEHLEEHADLRYPDLADLQMSTASET